MLIEQWLATKNSFINHKQELDKIEQEFAKQLKATINLFQREDDGK